MKKKLTIFALTVALMLTFSVIAFAEGEGTEPAWNLWSLLNLSNLDLGNLISILIASFGTILRIFGLGA